MQSLNDNEINNLLSSIIIPPLENYYFDAGAVQQLGLVNIEIGGSAIDAHYGSWMEVWNELANVPDETASIPPEYFMPTAQSDNRRGG